MALHCTAVAMTQSVVQLAAQTESRGVKLSEASGSEAFLLAHTVQGYTSI